MNLGNTIPSPQENESFSFAKKSFGFSLKTLLTSRLLIQADSGSGKSWAIRKLLEATYGHVVQWIFDPEGEFGSLRELGNYVIVGGENADIPADIQHVPVLVRQLVDLKVNVIFDLYDLPTVINAQTKARITRGEIPDPTRSAYLAAVLDTLHSLPKKSRQPMLIAIDEAQDFAPQDGKDIPSLVSIALLSSQGRKRGLCGVYATNRIGMIHKNAVAGIKSYLIGSAALDNDNKRSADYLGFKQDGQKELRTGMDPGQFYALGPAFHTKVPVKLMVGPVSTSHPQPGAPVPVVPAPDKQIKKVLEGLKDLPKQVEKEATDLAGLKSEITKLKGELKVAKQMVEVEVKETNVVEKKTVQRLERAVLALTKSLQVREKQIQSATKLLERERESSTELVTAAAKLAAQLGSVTGAVDVMKVIENIVPEFRPGPPKKEEKHHPPHHVPPPQPAGTVEGLKPKQVSILGALAMFKALGKDSVSRKHIAVVSGQSPKSSAYERYTAGLTREGFITAREGSLSLTLKGAAVAPRVGAIGEGDLLDAYRRHVLDGYQIALLDALVSTPGPITREQLSARSGKSQNSSGFERALAGLRSLDLIDYTHGGIELLVGR